MAIGVEDVAGQAMDGDQGQGSAAAARAAILRHLHREWPDSTDLTARALSPRLGTADFLAAATSLQDDGLIMYEALLLGTGPSPLLVAAVLTRKGQGAV